MLNKKNACSLLAAVCFFSASFTFAKDQDYKGTTTVTFNGEKFSVYFNDGDTFRILDGDLKNSRVRVAGFNTLETYGPVHKWSENDPHYLLDIANRATVEAQKGPWTCVSDNEKDHYGRILAHCDDLAQTLIAKGLAHVYSMDSDPAEESYIATQRTAQKKRIGMWKNGIPDYIITSVHSQSESASNTYNRLISTKDGHSKKWLHRDNYTTCQNVCLDDDGTSCMIYVPFEQRYGSKRPSCLL